MRPKIHIEFGDILAAGLICTSKCNLRAPYLLYHAFRYFNSFFT